MQVRYNLYINISATDCPDNIEDQNIVTIDDFQTCLGQIFIVNPEDEPELELELELELIQVKPNGTLEPESDIRQPFSVLFRGPLEPMLPQRIYSIKNTTFGKQMLFIVPVGHDEHGMLYDATFN